MLKNAFEFATVIKQQIGQLKIVVNVCPGPGQITVILCVRRAATSQPGRIAANLFVRCPKKQVAVIIVYVT